MHIAWILMSLLTDGHPQVEPVPQSKLVVEKQEANEQMIVTYSVGEARRRKRVGGPYWYLEYHLPYEVERPAIIDPLQSRERAPQRHHPPGCGQPPHLQRLEGRWRRYLVPRLGDGRRVHARDRRRPASRSYVVRRSTDTERDDRFHPRRRFLRPRRAWGARCDRAVARGASRIFSGSPGPSRAARRPGAS